MEEHWLESVDEEKNMGEFNLDLREIYLHRTNIQLKAFS